MKERLANVFYILSTVLFVYFIGSFAVIERVHASPKPDPGIVTQGDKLDQSDIDPAILDELTDDELIVLESYLDTCLTT